MFSHRIHIFRNSSGSSIVAASCICVIVASRASGELWFSYSCHAFTLIIPEASLWKVCFRCLHMRGVSCVLCMCCINLSLYPQQVFTLAFAVRVYITKANIIMEKKNFIWSSLIMPYSENSFFHFVYIPLSLSRFVCVGRNCVRTAKFTSFCYRFWRTPKDHYREPIYCYVLATFCIYLCDVGQV